MPRLLLHAGTRKTGTTSIQEVLAANRAWLRKRGVLYPAGLAELGAQVPHHRLAHGLVHAGSQDHARSLAFINRLRSRAAAFATVVISSEPIWRHIDGHSTMGFEGVTDYWPRREAYLARIASVFSGFDIEVLLFLREPDAFVASYFADLRNIGRWTGDQASFRKAIAPMLDYGEQIDRFRRVFPRLTLIDYDRFRDAGGSAPPFFAALGLPLPPGGGDVWARPRPAA